MIEARVKPIKIIGGVKRDQAGRFVRTCKVWSLKNFNDYKIINDRPYVYMPTHPRSDIRGYIPRAWAAYEAYHRNKRIDKKYDIHHCDEDHWNDSKNNLKKILHGKHTILHCSKPLVVIVCKTCNNQFGIPQWQINAIRKDARYRNRKRLYCSSKCYGKGVKGKKKSS